MNRGTVQIVFYIDKGKNEGAGAQDGTCYWLNSVHEPTHQGVSSDGNDGVHS